MLLQFTIENFLSFKHKVEFSLQPGKGSLLKDHKITPTKGQSTLKTSAMFGANAGGKSNFVKAIALGKMLVLRGTPSGDLIDFYPFRLDSESKNRDTTISYQILCNEKKYEYGFSYNAERINKEWLHIITRNAKHIVFQRLTNQEFDISYLEKINPKQEHQQYLNFFAKSTPDRQLFIHEVLSRNIKENVANISDILAVINWFRRSLKVIFPDTPYNPGLILNADNDADLRNTFKALLKYFNTGIIDVKFIDVKFDKLGISEHLQRIIKSDLSKSTENEVYGTLRNNDNLIILNYVDGELKAKKLMTVHKKTGNEESYELFSIGDESDGTNRLFDYIPLILDLIQGDKVFIIDEIERSLHPTLITKFIQLFHKFSTEVCSQLLFTTHASTLMDLKLLRRDEIWFIEMNEEGVSNIGRMDNLLNVRFDKSLQKDYLNGLLGGTPKIGDDNKLLEILKKSNQKKARY